MLRCVGAGSRWDPGQLLFPRPVCFHHSERLVDIADGLAFLIRGDQLDGMGVVGVNPEGQLSLLRGDVGYWDQERECRNAADHTTAA